MKRAKAVFRAGMVVATTALLLAYGLGQFWLGVVVALALGLAGWFGASDLFMAGVTVLVAVGTLTQRPSFLLLVALLGALAAWDLGRFEQRLEQAPSNDHSLLAMEQHHLERLLLALALGGAASGAALIIRVQLSFGLALILGLALVALLGGLLRRLDR